MKELSDRQQRGRVDSNISYWEKIIAGLPLKYLDHFSLTFFSMIFFFLSQVLI